MMKLFAILLALVLLINVHDVTVNCFDEETINTAKEIFGTGSEFLSKFEKFNKTAEKFKKISDFLQEYGPIISRISALFSNSSLSKIQIPGFDNEQVKAIKAGFEKVNNKLDILTSKLGNLANIAELSSAKSAFVNSLTVINSNYEALLEARKGEGEKSYKFFVKQFENTYSLATDKIYDSLVGTHGSMGFDVLNLYKIHVKCNSELLSQFCTKGLQLIVKGLDIEGAYMGYNDLADKAEAKGLQWKAKMEVFSKQCTERITECEANWKTYANQQFKDTYREVGGDNQAFANRLAKDLENTVSHRSFVAVVYDDAAGFGPHTYSSYYESEKIFHELGHCAAIASTPKVAPLEGAELDKLKQLIQAQVTMLEKVNDCDTTISWVIPAKKYQDNDARFMVERVRDAYKTGFVHAVNVAYKPGASATGGNFLTTEVKWKCTQTPFKLYVFN